MSLGHIMGWGRDERGRPWSLSDSIVQSWLVFDVQIISYPNNEAILPVINLLPCAPGSKSTWVPFPFVLPETGTIKFFCPQNDWQQTSLSLCSSFSDKMDVVHSLCSAVLPLAFQIWVSCSYSMLCCLFSVFTIWIWNWLESIIKTIYLYNCKAG